MNNILGIYNHLVNKFIFANHKNIDIISPMTKYHSVPLYAIIAMTSCVANANVMFAPNTQNSIAIYAAQSTGDGTLLKLIAPGIWDISPQTMVMAQYSQPTEIFRLDARINLNMIQNLGYNGGHGLSFFGMGISWDVALLQYHDMYMGIGMGPYMRNKSDRWVDSRLTFGEKFFIGKNISNALRMEIFTIHFSNGSFTYPNRGFNFAGLAVTYSF